ncbi:diguanylate cyclase [Aureimonas sp. Leaf324]|uniref:diguanylate cyclase domain-containing protein n=1 Tax=Aureimonas sp. Leaf324 TaxID=1736336 RepID=UPI0009E84C72|nr:diguanylate cyclase [Aureimonas sp. Leaf324]
MSHSLPGFRQLVVRVTKAATALVAVLLCGLLGVLWLIADYQTSVAQQQQAKLAEGAVTVRGEHIEKTAMDYGAWDEAVERLVVSPDPDWADENIGRPTFENLGFDMAFVVAPDDTATYAMVHGDRFDGPLSGLLAGGYETLLTEQRMKGAKGSTSGLIMADGKPAIAAIVPIRPLKVDPADVQPRHVLVLVDTLDDRMLAEFARIYLLPGLRIADGAASAQAHASLVTADHRQVVTLMWQGARPGDGLLAMAVPAWAVVALAFGALTFQFVRQTASAARAVAESEWRATHDALTGLPNRVLLFERMDFASRALCDGGAEFAVAYLDLDGFKTVNDTHGHAAGDLVLQEVARRLEASLGLDDFAARLGGDEFAVILPGRQHPQQALEFGRAIIDAIERPIPIGDARSIGVSAIVGFTFAPRDGTDPLMLLRNADQALYAGKRSGRRQVQFHVAAAA